MKPPPLPDQTLIAVCPGAIVPFAAGDTIELELSNVIVVPLVTVMPHFWFMAELVLPHTQYCFAFRKPVVLAIVRTTLLPLPPDTPVMA